ncbi:hypothetical protein RJT34_18273 [Clitoria ternatea]|uniref:RING-CH-type domain-containing protein n=1 Tax=Clitoria ternatea TaxID=43366 RepID=A0AAN9JC01_CLITE
MLVSNMEDHVTITPEKILGNPGQGSLTTEDSYIAFTIEELCASQEAVRDKKPLTVIANVDKVRKHEEQAENMGHCRYCHEDDFVSKLESPCACIGTLKYVHRSEEFTIVGRNSGILSPLAMAKRATDRIIASMNKDFTLRNPSGGVIFGTILLIFVAVLVIKDAYVYAPPKEDKFSYAVFCVSVDHQHLHPLI